MKKFRKDHLIKIVESHEQTTFPLDGFLRYYFRANKAIGSKDRKEICDHIYGLVRWKGLLDFLCEKPISWESRLRKYLAINPLDFKNRSEIPPHIKVSFPKTIYDRLLEHYGEEKTITFCLNSNMPAPTTVRANLIKTTRENLLTRWEGIYNTSPCKKSPCGITFHKKENFFSLAEFKEGLFEIQDEGSQLVAQELDPKGKDHILDFCAGSGGKTLAFAPKLGKKGQIYLYDIRPTILKEAKKRLKRAGIQNAQILDNKKLKKKGLIGLMDWILLDVPCSGTGTLRRNPDMKWKISQESIERLINEQRKVFDKILKFLRPNGKIVYATCSILPEENENQISYFMKTYGLKLSKPPFLTFPKPGEMDGFFCAVLSK